AASPMLLDLTDWVIDVIDAMSYLGVALLVALENLFPPIPSEIVLPFAGVVARRGGATLPGMIAAATVGSLVGALVLYGIAAAIGPERLRAFVARHGRGFRLTLEDIERGERWFERRAIVAVLGGPGVPRAAGGHGGGRGVVRRGGDPGGGGRPARAAPPVAGADPGRVAAPAARRVRRLHGDRQPELEHRPRHGRLRARRGGPLAAHRGRDELGAVRGRRRHPRRDRLVRLVAVRLARGAATGPRPRGRRPRRGAAGR